MGDFILGRGGFAVVTREEVDGRAVARKKLRFPNNPEHLEMIQNEAHFLKAVKDKFGGHGHPCIIDLLSYVYDGDKIVGYDMELGLMDLSHFLDGDFDKYQRKHVLRTVLTYTASGLQYVHTCCFVHGDVTTRNLLLMSNGNIKLIDHGTLLTQGMDDMCFVNQKEIFRCHPLVHLRNAHPSGLPWALGCQSLVAQYVHDWWAFGTTLQDMDEDNFLLECIRKIARPKDCTLVQTVWQELFHEVEHEMLLPIAAGRERWGFLDSSYNIQDDTLYFHWPWGHWGDSCRDVRKIACDHLSRTWKLEDPFASPESLVQHNLAFKPATLAHKVLESLTMISETPGVLHLCKKRYEREKNEI